MSAIVVILFGVSCADPCGVPASALGALEREVVGQLTEHGVSVRPAPSGTIRPTGSESPPEPTDVARRLDVDRVVAVDLEPRGERVWITHFLRGTPGPWSVGRAPCSLSAGRLECPGLQAAVTAGLRPRRAEDVDLTGALRAQANAVGACVVQEDRVPAAERIYGKVELDLEVTPNGRTTVTAIAPARVASAALGKCLRGALERIDVGPFLGDPIRLTVPLDL